MAKKTAIGIDLGTTYSLWTHLQSPFLFLWFFLPETTYTFFERPSLTSMISVKSQVASVFGKTTEWKLSPTTRATEPLLPMWPSLTLSDSSVMPPRTKWHVIPRTRLLDHMVTLVVHSPGVGWPFLTVFSQKGWLGLFLLSSLMCHLLPWGFWCQAPDWPQVCGSHRAGWYQAVALQVCGRPGWQANDHRQRPRGGQATKDLLDLGQTQITWSTELLDVSTIYMLLLIH